MGCAISCTQHRIIDSNIIRLNDNSSVEIISSSLQLINYFKDKDNNQPKCIFIFGTSGSSKGEFIYEMICASWMNYRNEQQYESQQYDCQKQKLIKEQIDLDSGSKNVLQNKENSIKVNTLDQHDKKSSTTIAEQFIPQIEVNRQDDLKYSINEQNQSNHQWSSNTQLSNRSSFSNISLNKYQDTLNFVYSYIDIERLILDNLKERIKNLGECGLIGNVDLFASDDEKSFDKKFGKKKLDHLNKNEEINKNELNDLNIVKENLDNKQENKLDNQMDKENSNDLKTKFNQLDDKMCNNKINNSQFNQSTKDQSIRKHAKRKRMLRNNYWAEFLEVCEEDFEFNQSRINVNYNSKALRDAMFTYANCVTNTWVFNLIEKEIDKRNQNLKKRFKTLIELKENLHDNNQHENDQHDTNQHDTNQHDHQTNHHDEYHLDIMNRDCLSKQNSKELDCKELDYYFPEIIYVINLIPNQINIFRHCLFLQQTPNLANFNVNFIAVNLISGDLIKKDLDSIISHTIQDELNLNYMNYFRSIDRLIDVQIRQLKQKIKIRITKSKNAIKMNNESDVQFLFGVLENNQEIDLSCFKIDQQSKNVKNEQKTNKLTDETDKGNLLFLLDDIVDIGDLLLCIEDHSLKMSTLRKFIQVYVKYKEKISFNRLYS